MPVDSREVSATNHSRRCVIVLATSLVNGYIEGVRTISVGIEDDWRVREWL